MNLLNIVIVLLLLVVVGWIAIWLALRAIRALKLPDPANRIAIALVFLFALLFFIAWLSGELTLPIALSSTH